MPHQSMKEIVAVKKMINLLTQDGPDRWTNSMTICTAVLRSDA